MENPLTLLEEAVALALLGAKEQGVRVTIRSDRDLPSIIVDKIQIRQVALNLIQNAIEAMASSPCRELTVGVTRVGGLARFTVADTGSGISPDVANRLFHPFITTKEHGMGVGLSICRTIIESLAATSSWKPIRAAARCFSSPCHLRRPMRKHDHAAHSCDRR
ncbi:sensor histidine kinase [Bradyrhizobium acaciae]|uniref:sensor histidine kinase n=1 Tax=Bradyrhizobium acaciae TaxID=2683706 RepID=UPI001E2F62FE|nr:ATP-binding protein [Bradyrhizobium acaciae]